MLRLAFDFIITWRETRTRPNAYVFSFCGCLSASYTLFSHDVKANVPSNKDKVKIDFLFMLRSFFIMICKMYVLSPK